MAEKESFVVQCARFSLYAPLAGIMLNCVSNMGQGAPRDRTTLLVIGFASYGIYMLGLILGIVALVQMREEDRPRAKWRALLGTAINGALVAIFTIVILMATQH